MNFEKMYFTALPVLMLVGLFIGIKYPYLLPLSTFGFAGLYLFFGPVGKKIIVVKGAFLVAFFSSLLASILLWLNG